jgi:hypothetical protein
MVDTKTKQLHTHSYCALLHCCDQQPLAPYTTATAVEQCSADTQKRLLTPVVHAALAVYDALLLALIVDGGHALHLHAVH